MSEVCPYCGEKILSTQRVLDINGILYHYECHRQMEESKEKQKMKLKQVCEKYNVSYEDALSLAELWEKEGVKKMNKFYDATQPYLDEFENEDGEVVSSIWLAELLLNGKVVGTLQGETEKEIQDLIERWTR